MNTNTTQKLELLSSSKIFFQDKTSDWKPVQSVTQKIIEQYDDESKDEILINMTNDEAYMLRFPRHVVHFTDILRNNIGLKFSELCFGEKDKTLILKL